jgi:Ser/Thr protein kinase RdoA (MazF antagonist)
LSSSGGRHAIKIYPAEYSATELQTEIDFAAHLLRAGIRVPRYLQTIEGRAFRETANGERVSAYGWLDGEVHETLDEAQLISAAQLLALIQSASADLSLERPDDWLWSDAIVCLGRLEPPKDLAPWLNEMIQAGRPWSASTKRVVSHNDFVPANLIWDRDNELPALIDFTNTILAPLEWDAAVFLASILLSPITTGAGTETIEKFFSAYEASGGNGDTDALRRLLDVALAQRSIFFAVTRDVNERQAIWQRLRSAVTT